MEWWQAVILGLVEGITEYLPISSTGHLILAAWALGLDEGETKSSVDAFTIAVQGGAILAVVGLYRERVMRMLAGLAGRDREGLRLAVCLFAAFLPAAVLGFLLSETIERLLFKPWPVVGALVVGGVFMLLLEAWRTGRLRRIPNTIEEKELDDLSVRDGLIIGLWQCVAMWPGTSRAKMSIAGGVTVGLRPAAAAEFSFLLGLPTLGGAMVYRVSKDFIRAGGWNGSMIEQLGVWPVTIGALVAMVSAAVAVKWLVGYLTRHGLAVFGWYRIFVGGVLGALMLLGWVRIGG